MSQPFCEQLEKAASFALERQKPDGGFGATPRLPATIEDTFHGLKILHWVGSYCNNNEIRLFEINKHLEFLRRFTKEPGNLSAKAIFQLVWCFKNCGGAKEAKNLIRKWSNAVPRCNSREGCYYLFRAYELIQMDKSGPVCREKFIAFDGILFKRWMAIYLDLQCKTGLINKEMASDWISRCQNYDGGFGFLPGSTSYLENSHYALVALSKLGKGLGRKRFEAIEFVLSCQSEPGGFSRKADAAPFLDATWHGTASLILLSKYKKPDSN